MEHHATTGETIINIVIQLLNIGLFFFVVIKFMGKPITNGIVTRMEKEKKLAKADETYQSIISDAEEKAAVMIQEAKNHKDNLIRQGELAGKQKYEELVENGERKAQSVVQTAERQAALIHKDLEGHFVTAVQQTSRTIVKKLLANKDFQDSYMEELVQEFTKTAKF